MGQLHSTITSKWFLQKKIKIKIKIQKMEKTRDPPPNQKTDDQNVSNTEEQLEKNIDVSIQNDKRFDDLKIEAIEKGEENATISKAAEQLEQIIDAPNQDEFGLPCITDVSN